MWLATRLASRHPMEYRQRRAQVSAAVASRWPDSVGDKFRATDWFPGPRLPRSRFWWFYGASKWHLGRLVAPAQRDLRSDQEESRREPWDARVVEDDASRQWAPPVSARRRDGSDRAWEMEKKNGPRGKKVGFGPIQVSFPFYFFLYIFCFVFPLSLEFKIQISNLQCDKAPSD
jgi:hypothetical protein